MPLEEVLLCQRSWNDPAKALQALRTRGLDKLLPFHAIEVHLNKALMAQRVLKTITIKERGLCKVT